MNHRNILTFAYMKKITLSVVLFALASVLLYACKEDEISNQQFVQNYFAGKWPRKTAIFKTTKNGAVIENDTLVYGLDSPALALVVDTVQFTADGNCIKDGKTLNFTIDELGDNITYSNDSIGTWNIKSLRKKSIVLTQEKTQTTGADTFIYYKEEQLVRN